MQDLTPQLRTRLSRVERAVGLFVMVATLLFLAGFGYYVYHTAKRKGWFVTRVTYYTQLYSAAGLKVGLPVKLWGFDVGEVTRIDTLPPEEFFNVYVEFDIRAPYFGYLTTEGSRVRVSSADFLGNRMVEVTKGTNYIPTHLTWEIREIDVGDAARLPELRQKVFLDLLRDPVSGEPLARPMEPLDTNVLEQIAAKGVRTLRIADRQISGQQVTAMWLMASNAYTTHPREFTPYWLPPDESPTLTERLEQLIPQVGSRLTNELVQMLTNAVRLTSTADELLVQTRPLLTNLVVISSNLTNTDGSLGRWLFPGELFAQFQNTLGNADGTLTNATAMMTNATATLTNANAILAAANTQFAELVAQLQPPLVSLSTIISNLNTQVQANTNFVTTLQTLLTHTDELIEGFKRHWLLRSAFKPRPTNTPPTTAPKRYAPPKGNLFEPGRTR